MIWTIPCLLHLAALLDERLNSRIVAVLQSCSKKGDAANVHKKEVSALLISREMQGMKSFAKPYKPLY